MEPFERSHQSRKDKYPLHLQSCHPDKRLHSQLCSSDAFRSTYAVAEENRFTSASKMLPRGVKADIARVFNARGQVLAGVVISPDFTHGVIRIHEGAWYSPQEGGKAGTLCTYGDPNVLSADIGTSQLAQGPSAHTVLVDVERYQQHVPPVTDGGPEIVKEEGTMQHSLIFQQRAAVYQWFSQLLFRELDQKQLARLESEDTRQWLASLAGILSFRWMSKTGA